MTTLESIPDTAQVDAASRLRSLVPELIVLTLDAKQAHWNVIGPSFLPLHALTEQIAVDARMWTDRVAERAVALGLAVDARPAAVAAVDRQFPSGLVPDHEVVIELDAALASVARTGRSVLPHLQDSDPVGHDIVIEVLEGLDKYRWMLRAHAT
jgi:starvation-inducible DNA-binding protein